MSFGYDDANRVVSTILPDGKAVGFAYDPNGTVTRVTPPGRPAHVFTYTQRNQLETYALPDVGTGPAVEERVYDASHRLQEVHRPDGKLIRFEYKPAGNRLEKIVSPRGETRFSYNPQNGLVAEIEEPDGQKLGFEYEGVLLKRTTWTGEVNGSVGRTYDNNFRVTSIEVNGQNPIQYVYDDDNLLVQVGEMTITRDPESGRELTTQLGNVTTERTYTPFGEPESYTAKFSGNEIYYEHFRWNFQMSPRDRYYTLVLVGIGGAVYCGYRVFESERSEWLLIVGAVWYLACGYLAGSTRCHACGRSLSEIIKAEPLTGFLMPASCSFCDASLDEEIVETDLDQAGQVHSAEMAPTLENRHDPIEEATETVMSEKRSSGGR